MTSRSRRWLLAALLVLGGAAAAGLYVSGGFSSTAPVSDRSAATPTAGSPGGAPAAVTDASAPTPTIHPGWVGADAPPPVEPADDVASDTPFTPQPGRPATVQVTSAGWDPARSVVEVYGFVPGVDESDGTCTVTLTKGGVSVTASASGVANGGSTACGELTVPRSGLSSGAWNAVLSYRSPDHQGTATAGTVDVP